MKLANQCRKVLGVSVIMALSTPTVFGATKNEMVFVTAESTGKTDKIIVSNHLEIDKETEVKDVSELDNIVNLKGDEVPQKDGNKITWKTNGRDIYYQGTTTKKLPVETKITYELDGKEIQSDQLSGQSGHLKITIKQTNTVKQTKKIEGKERQLYLPFYSLGIVTLDADVMQNIKLTNGKLVSDGSRKVIVGIMLPGMKENLGDSNIDFISDTMEIEGDIDNFSLEPIYIATTSLLPQMNEVEEIEELDKMTSSIDELQNATNDLVSGTKSLSEGIGTFNTKLTEFKVGTNNFIEGVNTLTGGITSLYDGAKALESGVENLYESSVLYAKKGQELTAGSNAQLEGVIKLNNSLSQVIESLPDELPHKAALLEISSGMNNLQISTETLNKGINEYTNKANEIVQGTNKLKVGSSSLLEGVKRANEGSIPLKKGSVTLQEGINGLTNASSELKIGAFDLADGASKFNEEGIKKLKNEVGEKLGQLDKFIEIKDALVEMSSEYTTFTGNHENNKGKVGFVAKIKGV